MPIRSFLILAAGALLCAQEPAYFNEAPAPWWRPKGELRVDVEKLPELDEEPGAPTRRIRGLLTLGWSRGGEGWTVGASLRAAAGDDPNRLNLPRYDQSPSNGTWLHRAFLQTQVARERGFGSLTLGLQENPLLLSESLWDHDLGVLGGGLRLAAREEARGLVEAGLRAVAGKVRTFPDGEVRVAAAQAVLRLETGPLRWTVATGPLELRWMAGLHRFGPDTAALPGSEVRARFLTAALGAAWGDAWPLELMALGERPTGSRATGGEVQLWTGPRSRRFWPRVGLIQQRILPFGTAPVNGDEWWFTHAAAGTRVTVQLPLGRGLAVGLSHVTQRSDEEGLRVRRVQASGTWRF